MTIPDFFDHLGRPVPLGRQLGKGGEGTVFDVSTSPNVVAKIYHNAPSPSHEAKLRAMVAVTRKELNAIAAWPISTLHDKPHGTVRGILMRKITDFKEIHFLYSPAHRKAEFSYANWQFLIHVAMNCAAAFDTLHSCGVVVGDVNQSNVLISAQGFVALIDCDSYQVQL
jgi:DNA-binding helix-hairpin-helix protein with protein kinase domain